MKRFTLYGDARGAVALACLLAVGCGLSTPSSSESSPDADPQGGTSMPKLVRLRQEQPGVVGVQATEWTIRDGVLRLRKLVNERVVADDEAPLGPDELRRVEAALADNDYANLPETLGQRRLEANVGKLVLETDTSRCEMAFMAGDPPEADTAGEPARLRAIAEVIQELGGGGRRR